MKQISEIIEDILVEWAYRVHDGMPNPKNVQHIQELRESMEELNLPNNVIYQVIQNLINEEVIIESKYEDVRNIIVTKLGSKLGLAGPPTKTNITSTKGEKSDTIAKEVEKVLGVKVKVLPPGKSTNKSSRFDALSFDYEGKSYLFKLSVGTGGKGGVPGNAADYEMGICVEYNKLKGMDEEKAFKKAEVDPKKYEPFKEHLTKVCGKIAKNLPNVGSSLRQTGGDRYTPSNKWPTSEGTPKTDIYGGSAHRISVKMQGGSQLVSGGSGDAKGVFSGALSFYQTHDKAKSVTHIQNLINSIENDFKKFNTDNSVGKVRKATGEAYLKWRIPEIEKEVKKLKLKVSSSDIEKHAKSELMGAGIIGQAGKWSEWPIDKVKTLSTSKVMSWFNTYIKKQGTKELQDEVRDIVTTAIDHKRIDSEFNKIFQDNEFKKWVVYEAASGNFKFSGDSNLNSPSNGIANELLVFGTNGSVEVKPIDSNWAKKYANSVTSNVGYKSSGRSKFTSFRLLSEVVEGDELSTFENDTNNIINEELNNFRSELNEFILEEGFFKNALGTLKKMGKKLLDKIKNGVIKFYNNVFKKIIKKLKTYAKQGIDKFAQALGIEIEGSAKFKVNF